MSRRRACARAFLSVCVSAADGVGRHESCFKSTGSVSLWVTGGQKLTVCRFDRGGRMGGNGETGVTLLSYSDLSTEGVDGLPFPGPPGGLTLASVQDSAG